MTLTFQSHRKLFIGVIHLPPLPDSPRWGGDMATVLRRAVGDARTYERGGANAVVIENFHDVPFTKDAVPPETLAAMAAAGCAVRAAAVPRCANPGRCAGQTRRAAGQPAH